MSDSQKKCSKNTCKIWAESTFGAWGFKRIPKDKDYIRRPHKEFFCIGPRNLKKSCFAKKQNRKRDVTMITSLALYLLCRACWIERSSSKSFTLQKGTSQIGESKNKMWSMYYQYFEKLTILRTIQKNIMWKYREKQQNCTDWNFQYILGRQKTKRYEIINFHDFWWLSHRMKAVKILHSI